VNCDPQRRGATDKQTYKTNGKPELVLAGLAEKLVLKRVAKMATYL
jgi:hypothetical protein